MLKIFLLCKIEYKIFDMKYNVQVVYVYSYRLTKNSFSIFDIRDPDFNFFSRQGDRRTRTPFLSVHPSVRLSVCHACRQQTKKNRVQKTMLGPRTSHIIVSTYKCRPKHI